MLRIVADANIAYARDAFGRLGDVVTLPSSLLTAEAVRGADLLLVRSTVKVGPALLAHSRVRFVATATIGIDHLDTAWLDGAGIRWASAPGSNADSVVQWFAAARRVAGLSPKRVGIVGVGNVGGRIERLCRAIGDEVLRCDPPRLRREGGDFVALDELLASCDLVTLHVPLTREGEDATFHLLDERRLRRLPSGAWLINASRGEVVDGKALYAQLRDHRLGGALLDVFEDEPAPSPELVALARIATPHIAGHSLDGKANGTQMVYEAACAFLGITPLWSPRDSLPPRTSRVSVNVAGLDDAEVVLEAVRGGYRIADDDAALRAIAASPADVRAAAFRRYREQYPERRELGAGPAALSTARPRAIAALNALGVAVEPA
jgi:erythronate-4-phosphate dehydrogenase